MEIKQKIKSNAIYVKPKKQYVFVLNAFPIIVINVSNVCMKRKRIKCIKRRK